MKVPQEMHGGAGRVPSDGQLLDRFVKGRDQAAFADLVARHGKSVWGVCRRVLHQDQDAEDAFQAAFVVLARKAGSIRSGEAVGSWLYGVAYRIAMKERQKLWRRRGGEKNVPAPGAAPPSWSDASCRELQRILDEEVDRLATKYRAPFVLCCLEGMGKAEAARELGWKEGTVSGRLARARKLLQARLARRGITLSAALTALTLAQESVHAAAPALLMHAATQAALTTAAGQTSALSPAVVALADNFVRAGVVAKLQVGVSAFVAFTLALAGAGLAALHFGSETAPQPPAKPSLDAPPPLLFHQNLRGEKANDKWLSVVPADGQAFMKTEPEGLRISLPGKKVDRQPTGFRSRFRLHGDFDISLSYELLEAPRPVKGNGIGVSIYLKTSTLTDEAVMLGRFQRTDGSLYVCSTMTTNATGKRQYSAAIFATQVRSGKLRLARLGSVVKFLVAEEDPDAFRELDRHELGPEDVAYFRVAADAGTADSPALEARLHEFEVRASGELATLLQPKGASKSNPPKLPRKDAPAGAVTPNPATKN